MGAKYELDGDKLTKKNSSTAIATVRGNKIFAKQSYSPTANIRGNKIYDENNFSFQPRVSARYLLSENWSLKASYANMQQNIHLLSNSSVGFPSDIWVPAIDSVPSQKSEQWAGSISTLLFQGAYELSLEGYYKTMSNLINWYYYRKG